MFYDTSYGGNPAQGLHMGPDYAVGNNYVTLYQDLEDRYVVCDLYSIKFVTFYNTRSTPRGRGTINAPAGNAGSRSM